VHSGTEKTPAASFCLKIEEADDAFFCESLEPNHSNRILFGLFRKVESSRGKTPPGDFPFETLLLWFCWRLLDDDPLGWPFCSYAKEFPWTWYRKQIISPPPDLPLDYQSFPIAKG